MRVIHIIAKFTRNIWGGAESLIVDLVRNYPPGIEGEVWTCRTPGDQRYEIIEGLKIKRFATLYPFDKGMIGVGKPGFPPGLLLGLLNLRKFKEPVLFHIHCHNSLATAAVMAGKIKGIKSILTLHSQVAHLRPYLRYYLTNEFSIRYASHVVAVSEVIAYQTTAVTGRQDIDVIPNGIDFTWLQGGSWDSGRRLLGFSVRDKVKILLFVGRIARIKNLETLLEAFAILLHSMGMINARLVVVGPNSESGYLNFLQETASKLGITNHVLFWGPVPHRSKVLADLYAVADVMVIPSKFEAQSVAVLEAWAAGKPVVVADVGGMGPMVRQLGAGFVWVPNTGPTGLAKILFHVLVSGHSKELLIKIRMARDYYDIRKIVEKYVNIYENLVKK